MLHLSTGQKMTLSFAARGGPKASASHPLARSSPLKRDRGTRLCFWSSGQVRPPPSKESRAVLGLAQVRTTEEPQTAQGASWEELRAPHQYRSWGNSLHLRALPLSLLLFYQLASTFQLGSSCVSFSKEKTKKKKEGKEGTWTGRCFGSGFVTVESHKEQSPRDCFL